MQHSYLHGLSADEKHLTFKISCSDVADFMLNQIENDAYSKHTVGLSY